MLFSIHAKSGPSGASDITETAATKPEAIRKAVDFQGQGYTDVKIIVDGKAYDPMSLVAANVESK